MYKHYAQKRDFMTSYNKNRVLALYKYLLENTDENHRITMQEIVEHMKREGYSYSRDTAQRNIKQLREELGIDVISSRGKYANYYVGDRLLEKEELKLIVDSINASNFIEKDIAQKMTDKLKCIVSKYDAEELQRNVLGVNVAKTENKKILYNVNIIQEALRKNVQISFFYRNWNIEKELVRKSRRKYTLNPWALIWANDRYYLFGYDVDEKQSERHYRVDKLEEIEILDIPRKGEKEFSKFDATTYVSRRIGMFSGKEIYITVKVNEKLVGPFIDQFGTEIVIGKTTEEGVVKISFHAVDSPSLFGWLIGLGEVEVVSPKETRKKMLSLIEKNSVLYQKS